MSDVISDSQKRFEALRDCFADYMQEEATLYLPEEPSDEKTPMARLYGCCADEVPNSELTKLSVGLELRVTELADWFSDNPNTDDIADALRVLVCDVAFAERDACAALCEEVVTHPAGYGGSWEGYGPVKTQRGGKECAVAIRMRSNA